MFLEGLVLKMTFREGVLGVRWKFCVCWSVMGKQKSRLRDRRCSVFTHQGPAAFWSDTSCGKWELQQMLDLFFRYARVGCFIRGICPMAMSHWGVSEWGSCHWSEWGRNGLGYGLSILHVIIWTLRIWVAGRLVTVWKSAAGCSFASGKSEETWEAVRHWGQEKSFPCSSRYMVIACFPSVWCSDQRRWQSYLNKSSVMEPRVTNQANSFQS